MDDVLTACKEINIHASQWYFLKAEDLYWFSWCFDQILEDWEIFMRWSVWFQYQLKWYDLLYRARLLISMWENEQKLKDTRDLVSHVHEHIFLDIICTCLLRGYFSSLSSLPVPGFAVLSICPGVLFPRWLAFRFVC